MITLNGVKHWYICCGYTDMRYGLTSLAFKVQQSGLKVDEGSVFLFCGRQAKKIKALYYSGDSYVVQTQTVLRGRFQWPRATDEIIELDEVGLSALMSGRSISNPNRKPKHPILPGPPMTIA